MGDWDRTLVLSKSNNYHTVTSVPRLQFPNDCLSGEVFKFYLLVSIFSVEEWKLLHILGTNSSSYILFANIFF